MHIGKKKRKREEKKKILFQPMLEKSALDSNVDSEGKDWHLLKILPHSRYKPFTAFEITVPPPPPSS